MSVLLWWCLMMSAPPALQTPLLRAQCAQVLSIRVPRLIRPDALQLSVVQLQASPAPAPLSLPLPEPAHNHGLHAALRSPWTWLIAGTALVGLGIGAYALSVDRRERRLAGSLSWGP